MKKPFSSISNTQITTRIVSFLLALGLCCVGCSSNAPVDSFVHPPTKAPTPTFPPPAEIDLSSLLDADGRLSSDQTFQSPDACLTLEVAQGTAVLKEDGSPASNLTIQINSPGAVPKKASGTAKGLAYRFGPDDLSFNQPVRLNFVCLPNYQRNMIANTTVALKGDDGSWEQIGVSGDTSQLSIKIDELRSGVLYFLVVPAMIGS